MKRKKRTENVNKKPNLPLILSFCLVLFLLLIPIGFSSLSTSLSINGSTAFEPVGMIRVMSISQDSLIDARESSISIDPDAIKVLIDIDDINGSATYNVVIKNLGQTDKVLDDIVEEVFSNNQIEYTLTGLQIGDIIRAKDEVEFKVTFKYKNGVSNILETRSNNILRFVFDDYQLPSTVGYFKPFDGTDNLFGKDKANIVSFERCETLTLEQVLAKSEVITINNESSDQYNSSAPIYAWVENNKFYWWSTAEMVYFHPETLKAFANMPKVTSIDLTGISTEKVENFSHWFDKDRVLKTITGVIDTKGLKLEYNNSYNYAIDNDENGSSGKGLAYMFNDCNALEKIDLSGFTTTNASDMKRMFAGCNKLKTLDLSTFDTSNVKSMYWMFRKCSSLTELDLNGFNTSNVVNMFGMFVSASSLKMIEFGSLFDTSNVVNMTNMFYGCSNLTTIYARSDFTLNQSLVSTNMFNGTNRLVGGAGTDYQTSYSSSNKTATYAKIANSSHPGYFTQNDASRKYTITYNYNGGEAINPDFYTEETPTFTLATPIKTGYTFTGWTGSNGNIIQKPVTITLGTTGNKTYNANYTANNYTVEYIANGGTGTMINQVFTYDQLQSLTPNLFEREGYTFVEWNTMDTGMGTSYNNNQAVINLATEGTLKLYAIWRNNVNTFPKVFAIEGSCTFNGSTANISACPGYEDNKYINTGIYLYNSENYQKDYEIGFEITSYNPNNQDSGQQQTFMNSKFENSSVNYPGIVFRRSGNNLELTQKINGVSKAYSANYSSIQKVKIIRRSGIVYYSINNGELVVLQNMTNFNSPFNVPVTFGASLDANGNPMRYLKATLSNIYIKLGEYQN